VYDDNDADDYYDKRAFDGDPNVTMTRVVLPPPTEPTPPEHQQQQRYEAQPIYREERGLLRQRPLSVDNQRSAIPSEESDFEEVYYPPIEPEAKNTTCRTLSKVFLLLMIVAIIFLIVRNWPELKRHFQISSE